jgi:hypothetical protein
MLEEEVKFKSSPWGVRAGEMPQEAGKIFPFT